MLSDAVVCPHRPDYRYVNVLLFADGDERQPFILPYVFKPHVDVDVGNGTAVARKTTRRHRDEDVSDKRDEHAISEESKGSNESMEKAATTLTSTTTTTLRNKLDDWEMVNERGELSRHQIKEFTQH